MRKGQMKRRRGSQRQQSPKIKTIQLTKSIRISKEYVRKDNSKRTLSYACQLYLIKHSLVQIYLSFLYYGCKK